MASNVYKVRLYPVEVVARCITAKSLYLGHGLKKTVKNQPKWIVFARKLLNSPYRLVVN